MTRSDKDALSDAQLALGTACETMLASDKYQRSNPMTHTGLVERLEMLPEHGLPRMRLVPQSKLEELGRIPRSNENFQVDALEAVKRLGAGFDNRSKAVLLVRRPLLPHRTPPPPLPTTPAELVPVEEVPPPAPCVAPHLLLPPLLTPLSSS